MEIYIINLLKEVLQANLNSALDFIGLKYNFTLEHIPNEKYFLCESRQIDSCPSLFIFTPSEDLVGDRMIWSMDEGDFLQYTFYIDLFVEDDDPEECLKRAMLYKQAVRKILRENLNLGNVHIHGGIVKATRNSNLFQLNQNLNMGVRIIYNVIAWEFDYFPMQK